MIETLKFVYDCLNKSNPPQFHDYYKYSVSNHNTASSRDFNYNCTMSNMIIMDGASSAQLTAAETWLLAKHGVAVAPEEGDEDATFFAELNLKVR